MSSFRRVVSSILLPAALVRSFANNKTFASSGSSASSDDEQASSPKPNVFTITAPTAGIDYRKWDANWDLRAKEVDEGNAEKDATGAAIAPSAIPGYNKAVHQIVLIRHGQYDQTHNEDHRRVREGRNCRFVVFSPKKGKQYSF